MILLYLRLFWTFFQIGILGFGGGLSMLSIIQSEVVTHNKWMSIGEFTDIVAVSQSTPGPISINTATYVGYTALLNAGFGHGWGVLGSFIATFAVIFPTFVLMVIVSKFLLRYHNHPAIQSVFMGLRPAVVGLLAAAALLFANRENFGSLTETPWEFCISIGIFIGVFIAMHIYKVSPVKLFFCCGLIGILLF